MGPASVISAGVEGIVDEAVAIRLIRYVGALPGTTYGKNGKARLRQRINAYNMAAQYWPWIVIVDLDREFGCAPPLRATWLRRQAPGMCFRIAVRAVEAWILADGEEIAGFLGVPSSRIPRDPEALDDPKETLVNLARASRRRDIREDMVPTDSGGRRVGPAYTSRLVEFVSTRWQPDVGAQRAVSLRRAIDCLRRLA